MVSGAKPGDKIAFEEAPIPTHFRPRQPPLCGMGTHGVRMDAEERSGATQREYAAGTWFGFAGRVAVEASARHWSFFNHGAVRLARW
jgi:hypothetical protein